LASAFSAALAAHQQAVRHLEVARQALAEQPAPVSTASADMRSVVQQLAATAGAVAPGWLGADLSLGTDAPLGVLSGLDEPVAVRVGEVHVSGAGGFPVLVPLLGGAHLALDADARDGRVAAFTHALVLRLVAAGPIGRVRVAAIDPAALGATFLPLRSLQDAGVLGAAASSDEAVGRVLDEAEAHARAAQAGRGDGTWLVLVAASMPASRSELGRLAALTFAGPSARVCVIVAGWPKSVYGVDAPELGSTTIVRVEDDRVRIGDESDANHLAVPVTLDADPASGLVGRVAAAVGEQLRRESTLTFTDLIPESLWDQSSIDGLRTMVGRSGRTPRMLAFDDVTPHWLIGGRTGSGKTVLLLDVLYGLAARYSPDELALYLLDFKEGISFTEFTPTRRDSSFIPHARAVGVESDREYGVAVLRELRREMNRRANELKQHGVTKLSDLRRGDTDVAMPRIVTVIDEFQVLFDPNDYLARDATELLEELARKGRSYGIHLVLASQTMSGIEALYGKTDSIFGQFPLRVALPGGSGVLDTLNTAADAISIGTAIINPAGGIASANQTMRFPDAHADPANVAEVRHRLWQQRTPGTAPPAVFEGYATRHLDDDPVYASLAPGARRPWALVGRLVDVGQTTASFTIDPTPGRHLAIVGTSAVGADILSAATLSLARQHTPEQARFLVAPLVAAADDTADATSAALTAAGHTVTTLDAAALRDEVRKLADITATSQHSRTYLVVFGVDAAGAVLSVRDPDTFRSGQDDLQALLRNGPAYGTHLLGWWRGLRRLSDDIGGSGNREDIACMVALNVPAGELALYLGETELPYRPRANRALLIDRHDQRTTLIVPFVRPGHQWEVDT
jgi:hypothetical protein